FSKTLASADWNNTKVVKQNAEGEVAKLKKESGNDLYIFGSANLSAAFTRKGLIDEYRLCVAPIVLGGGNPLFKESPEHLKLKLTEARPLKSGGVDRKSTRLNSSHEWISYAVFCLKKKI